MALDKYFNKPGPGVDKNAPQKTGFALFFEILWREFWEILKLNMLFLLFCLPVVTIPAAMTAMGGVTLTMVRDENHFLFQDFWRVFKREFGRSLGAGWLLLLGMAATGYGVYFYSAMTAWGWMRIVPSALGVVAFLILFSMSFYVFSQLAMLDLPFRAVLKNAFYLTFVRMSKNLIMMVLVGLILFISVGLLPYSTPAVAMLIFSICSLIVSFHTYPAIKQYLIAAQDAADGTDGTGEAPGDWKAERQRLGKDGGED